MNGAGAGIAQQGIGVLAAFTGMVKDSTGVSLGSDYLHEKMLYWQSRSAAWETLAQMGNTGVAGEAATKILGGAASTLPSLAGGVLLRAAVAPFTTSQVVLRTAGMVGASGTAAAQSAAGMYSEVYAVNRQRGMPEEQARRTALKPALIAGVITAALSYRGGANGAEAFFREEGREVLKRTLWEHAKAMGRDITEEMLEEGADTFLQELTKMVHLYPDRSMRDILSVTLDGALTGGGVAGMMVGGKRVFGGGRGHGGPEGPPGGDGVPPYLSPEGGQMSGMERGQDLQLPSVRGQDGMARAGEANPLGAGVMHNSLDNGGTDNGAAAGAKPGDAALPGGEPLVPELVGGPKADEETGHAVPPKVNDEDRRDDDGDGKPENDEALVPEMAGGPKADEESDHAVPPGGGMGTGGGSTGGTTTNDSAAGGMRGAGELPPLTPEQRTSKRGAGKPQTSDVEEAQSEPVRKLSSRPWAENEGRVRAAVPAERLRGHPDYTAAMAGDAAAAQRMVGSLASGNHLREVAARHPRARIVAAPDSRQPGRANPVAQAYAQHLQAGTSLQINSEISLRVAPVSADAPLLTRMAFQPQFQGKVEKGAEYIIVADQVGTGVSAASLRHYVERNGGRVVFIDTLGTSGSQDIAITPATRDAVIARYGAVEGINARLRASGFYGGRIGSLSEAEGRELLRFGTQKELEIALEKEAAKVLAAKGIPSPSSRQLREARGLIGWDDLTQEDDRRLYELRSNLRSPTNAERRRLGKKFDGNIAFLIGTIEGHHLEGYERLSGMGTKGMPLATPSRYETVPTSISRDHDSEVYLFGNLAANLFKQFGAHARDAKGKIVLMSERGICPSCQGVVQMFKEDFPNITVEIRTGKD